MEKFHSFEEPPRSELEQLASKICAPYRSPTESDPDNMRKPAVDRIARKIKEAPAEIQEELLRQPEIMKAIISDICSSYRSPTESDPDNMRKPAVDRIARKIKEAPAELQDELLRQPEIMKAIISDICSSYRSPTESDPDNMRKPAVDRIARKIKEAPAEIQEELLHQPEVIEAITTACIKGDRVLESQTTNIPESIKAVIFADPRIQERLKK